MTVFGQKQALVFWLSAQAIPAPAKKKNWGNDFLTKISPQKFQPVLFCQSWDNGGQILSKTDKFFDTTYGYLPTRFFHRGITFWYITKREKEKEDAQKFFKKLHLGVVLKKAPNFSISTPSIEIEWPFKNRTPKYQISQDKANNPKMGPEFEEYLIVAKHTWEQIFKGGNVCYKKGLGFATMNKNLFKQKLYLMSWHSQHPVFRSPLYVKSEFKHVWIWNLFGIKMFGVLATHC